MDEAQVTKSDPSATTKRINHFRKTDILRGLKGSLSPSQSTRWSPLGTDGCCFSSSLGRSREDSVLEGDGFRTPLVC